VKYLASSLSPLATSEKKPVVVFFYDPDDKKEMSRIQDSIFKVENVGAMLRAFKLYRLNVESIGREDLKNAYSKNTPKFYFLNPEGELVTRLERGITTPNFLASLNKAFAASYAGMTHDAFLKAHRAILDRLDSANGKKALIAGKREQLKTRTRNDKVVSLEKNLDRDEAKLKDDEEKIAADEKKLFESLKAKVKEDLVTRS
jgi:hypothetical protein